MSGSQLNFCLLPLFGWVCHKQYLLQLPAGYTRHDDADATGSRPVHPHALQRAQMHMVGYIRGVIC